MASTRSTTWTRKETWHGHELETECLVKFTVSGRHVRATRLDPEEFPEIEIDEVTVEATGEVLTDLTSAEEDAIVSSIEADDHGDEDDRGYDDSRDAHEDRDDRAEM